MGALAQAHALTRLLDENEAWRLLRADNAPVIAAILDAHLGGEERRIESEELYERIDVDLDDLRAHGFDLPLTARAYCTDWRQAGYLVRRPAESSRGETFELSPAALAAIRLLNQLAQPRQTATESRLTSIADQLHRLAVDSDPDARTRIARLEEQRERIDAEIEAVNRGEAPTLDPERAMERVREVLTLAEDIPSDFARVRAEFESLNRDLQATFPRKRSVMTSVDWGPLYNQFKDADLDSDILEAEVSRLIADPDVTNHRGVYTYVLTGAEKHLSIRAFDARMRQTAYEQQAGICPSCGEHFELHEMHADHKLPWSKGGKTIAENCILLCAPCNRKKWDI
ncbi:hypothetical protein GCM10027064_06730 [Microbacterium petrolearium]